MNLEDVRGQLMVLLRQDSHLYDDLMSNTMDARYAIDSWDIHVPDCGLFVDIHNYKFRFQDARLSVRLKAEPMAKNVTMEQDFNTLISGEGAYELDANKKVKITIANIDKAKSKLEIIYP